MLPSGAAALATMGYALSIDGRVFPYLVDPDRVAVGRYGVPAAVVIQRETRLVERGVERLLSAIRRLRVGPPAESVEEEVIGFYVAALLAGLSGNRWVVSRLALAEANRAQEELMRMSDEAVALIGRLAGLASLRFSPRAYVEPVGVAGFTPIYRVYGYSVLFVEYVEAARRLLGDDAWRPVNLPVLGGRVFLDKHRAVRLVKEALTTYIESRILEISSSAGSDVSEVLAPYLEKVWEAVSRATRRGVARTAAPQPGVIVEEAFPPCMRDIYERAKKGEHLSHHERFAIATFLLNIGASVDYVVDVFRSMPDFKENITRYQVEHLAGMRGSGKKYRTYSCEKMRTLGLCKADCGTKSPVQAYYLALRKRVPRNAGAKEQGKGI